MGGEQEQAPRLWWIFLKLGILTIAIITKPFDFEGGHRLRIADQGLQNLAAKVDIIVVMYNEKLLRSIDKATPLIYSFKMADDIWSKRFAVFRKLSPSGFSEYRFADIKALFNQEGRL